MHPKVVYRFNSIEAIKQTIAAGTGVTLLPDFAMEQEYLSNNVNILPWKGPDFDTDLLFIWNKEKDLIKPLQIFMDMVRKYLKGNDSNS